MAKNSFGKKLQMIRKSKNLTQAKLAELAGIDDKHLSKIETGIYFPTYITLNKILTALEIDIDDVGLNLSKISDNDSPFFLKSIQILNGAKNEQELEYYYGFLRQAQKGIDLIRI